mmetsp:Transcript_432/g.1292  ORF Transcript_432/g.1292 Transcript_432/m.1292 type:complete len:142 (+) Transcript_432:688-1113(+)|eukprot:CAMPEP_0181032932 /NCGR_PEP_ID=MMETSP1070-20121207/6991_1 /TAXON_ID=265543 /ORGANISM="Minutocellus polymorphus, Strain NH13" /LENGTH=141 /DNA_ID=CAMNT_0023110333 /DNA_START=388 /DNA_END=813 /DNA_ORIENTATION=+
MAPKTKRIKANTDQPLEFDSRHPRLAVTLHPGSQAKGYPGRGRAPFELCLLSTDETRFSILEAYDEARRGGSILYKVDKGSLPVSELPGKRIAVVETNTAIFGAFGGKIFELTDRLKTELYGHVEASSDSGSGSGSDDSSE